MTTSHQDLRQSASEDPIDPDLCGALIDLQEAADYAREEGFPIPSEPAISNAERLLKKVRKISSLHLEVYPTPDGEIAVHTPNGRGRSVVLLCDSDGGILCLANLDSGHRRNSYATVDALPDKFLRRALVELENDRT